MNVAMVADKFDCVAAIMLPSKIWFQHGIESFVGPQNTRLLMLTAYILDSPIAFPNASWRVLFAHVGPHLCVEGVTSHEIVTHFEES